ncbi:MAG TPA: ATP-binding protein [Spirochaetia bacterium]|nr:ATP-binding protein [Spirochaetia bacterium]
MERQEHELAEAYQAEELSRINSDTRVAAVAASIAIMLFYALDYIVYPLHRLTFLFLRVGVVFLSAIIFAVSRSASGRAHPIAFAIAQYLATCIPIVVMVHMTGGYESPYYAGIIVVLIAFVAMLPLDVTATGVTCAVVYVAYIVPSLVLQRIANVPVFASSNFFLLFTMLFVVVSSHLASRMRHHEFSARFRLAQANEELKALDVIKSQFFANISHEVRTPLTSIVSPIQSMYQGDAGEFSRPQRKMIEQIYRNSLRLLDMINQMLDFSRFEARKMQVRLSLTNVDELIRDTVAVFEELTSRKGLELRYESLERLTYIYLDRDKVERILTNLLRNAVKFTEEGVISIRARITDAYLTIEVEDTGIGIPAEHLPHIFERFRQVDSSSTRRYEGTGLGLTIVREAAELLLGTVAAESEPQKGTCFTVRIPIDLRDRIPDAFVERRGQERRQDEQSYSGPERRRNPRRTQDAAFVSIEDLVFIEKGIVAASLEAEEPGNAESAAVSESGESVSGAVGASVGRVLYVEDNAELRDYVSRMLTRHGHDVQTASDGLEGWAAVQSWRPDVVVSDVMMPGIDGLELIRYMKNSDDTKMIPVILITARSEIDAKIAGLESGADDYLPKPINIRELDARIRNLVSRLQLERAEVHARELEKRVGELAMSFAQSLEIRDSNTAGHSRDVLRLGSIIAGEMGLPVDRVLNDSLLLHDIGKLGIPDHILRKPAPLDNSEWEIMKKHADIGADLLAQFDNFREISEIVRAHQEHADGTGYPRGLKDGEIPLYAGIVAVADAFHAMTTDRPYRKALPVGDALGELVTRRGTQFSPEIVDALVRGLLRNGIASEKDVAAALAAADQQR